MDRFIDNISAFLTSEGFNCSQYSRHGLEVICISLQNGDEKKIIPLEISAQSKSEAKERAKVAESTIRHLTSCDGEYPLIITEDRWNTQPEIIKARILAHLEIFSPIYARNCEVRKIDKTVAKRFLSENHSYGHAACRYCYGLYFKRHTGHIAETTKETSLKTFEPGMLLAVATFSNARKWAKGDKTIRSYEWTRYASLPQVRLSGGMGKLLKTFINEVQPDDIMSYADLEWSEGTVYSQLGFKLEGQKDPVLFKVDNQWERTPIRPDTEDTASAPKQEQSKSLYFQNFGSNKYRLKLTDYE